MPAVGALGVFNAFCQAIFGIFLGFLYWLTSSILSVLAWDPAKDWLDMATNGQSESLTLALSFVNWICPLDVLSGLMAATVIVFSVALVYFIGAKFTVRLPAKIVEIVANAIIPKMP